MGRSPLEWMCFFITVVRRGCLRRRPRRRSRPLDRGAEVCGGCCYYRQRRVLRGAGVERPTNKEKSGAPCSAPDQSTSKNSDQLAAARGARLRELRWKNSAWLATAETIAGWNGFEIRNAGSGRSPGRKRPG